MSELEIVKTKNSRIAEMKNIGPFGTIFSDHMFVWDYSTDKKWYNPRIVPYGKFEVEPTNITFHYGQAVFEGMKAYVTKSGQTQLFRPLDNMKRLNISCERLCIPTFDENKALSYLKELLKVDKAWVPTKEDCSLYIRPFVIATDNILGVRASSTYKFFIVSSPVGAYYPEGFSPVKILVTDKYVRAVRGGIGFTKAAANYAASLYAGNEAKKMGYSQVLWLDAIERKYIEEVGTMNIFFVINKELVTPPLEGSILPGITRDCVIKIAKDWGIKVSERKISIDEVIACQKNGSLKEMFGSGTAAVISPVKLISYKGQEYTIADGKVGDLSNKLFNYIQGIQYGTVEDKFGWIVKV